MSNTRKAATGTPPRQERFASSPEFNKGLMANLVARRCQVLDSLDDRKLIWFLQSLSHRAGGLRSVAEELLRLYPERNATAAMQKFGTKPGQMYSANLVKEIREEIPGRSEEFPLKGELTFWEQEALPSLNGDSYDCIHRAEKLEEAKSARIAAREKAANRPVSYGAERFQNLCREAAAELPGFLERLCLDPAVSMNCGPWWFPSLFETLREFQSARIESSRANFLLTEVGESVFSELDYAFETRTACMIIGREGRGKSEAAKGWCALHPGQSRYVEVPSTSDDIGFYSRIAKSLGVSVNLNSKAQELRQRIEETLQTGDLLLVFDECHYLWPNLIDPRTLPSRINWLMTALINFHVPVVLICTPQFYANQKAVEEKTRWTSGQFVRRIEHCRQIPDVVPESDFFGIAKFLLPEGDPKSVETIVRYAQLAPKYLSEIKVVVRRARFIAKQAGREKVSRADVVSAIENYEMPSDNAIAGALQTEPKRRRKLTPVAPAVHEPELTHNRFNSVSPVSA
jgi:hypothetical protein